MNSDANPLSAGPVLKVSKDPAKRHIAKLGERVQVVPSHTPEIACKTAPISG